jgi:hypothetical protein
MQTADMSWIAAKDGAAVGFGCKKFAEVMVSHSLREGRGGPSGT